MAAKKTKKSFDKKSKKQKANQAINGKKNTSLIQDDDTRMTAIEDISNSNGSQIGSQTQNKISTLNSTKTTKRSQSLPTQQSKIGGRQGLAEKLQAKINEITEKRKNKQKESAAKMKMQRMTTQKADGHNSHNSHHKKAVTEDLSVKVNVQKRDQDIKYEAPKKGAKFKNLEADIRNLERDEKKLSKLSVDERVSIEAEDRMNKALKKASGEKIRDDVNKLKKTQKNLVNEKQKRIDKRSERVLAVQKAAFEKQERRAEHLSKRAEKKKFRPGFEGARGVINKDKDL